MKPTTVSRTLTAAAIAVVAVLTPITAGVASAAPAATPAHAGAPSPTDPAPSSCRPANLRGTVAPDQASAGHRHYRVTLVAAPDTSPCTLAGSPTGVGFDLNGSPRAVSAESYGDQTVPVAFGPGMPVHFDIQVPSSDGPTHANDTTFTLQAPGGEIPGQQSAAGWIDIDAGTQVGAITPGA